MANRIRLKDIAEALNVSVTTVSRALNNKFDINPETRKIILAKAEELRYRPNAMAISLRKNEYFTIGVILPIIDHYFFSTVLKGIMNKAHKANYLVIIGESNHEVEREKEIIDQFVTHCVTGVILSASNNPLSKENLDQLRFNRIPYTLVDRATEMETNPFVKYDDYQGAFLAVEHLIDQGYKKIALIKGFDYCVISNARLRGYKAALEKYNLEYEEHFVKSVDHDHIREEGYLLSRQLLLSRNRPDAFFTITDSIASGVYKAAKELNLRIPQDIGVVGYSNSSISKHLSPPLSTVGQPGKEMGELAFDFLQQVIIGNDSKLSKTFDANLIIRDSSIR